MGNRTRSSPGEWLDRESPNPAEQGSTAAGGNLARDNLPPGLVERAQSVLRLKHYALRTERSYLLWLERFLAFHHHPNPNSLQLKDVEAFLTHLAAPDHVAASTQT